MLTLLHGDDIVSSRKALEEIRLSRKDSEILILDGKKAALVDLTQALESLSMLFSSRLVILENFLSSRPAKEKLAYLFSGGFSSDLVLWEGKKIPPASIKKFGSEIKVRLFKTPAVVFQFLDNFSPKNKKGGLLFLQRTLKSSPPSLVFFLLVKRVRNLLIVKDGGKLAGMQVWRLRKLQNQTKLFSLGALREIYKKLLLIDVAQKTGEERFGLAGEVEMLVLGF